MWVEKTRIFDITIEFQAGCVALIQSVWSMNGKFRKFWPNMTFYLWLIFLPFGWSLYNTISWIKNYYHVCHLDIPKILNPISPCNHHPVDFPTNSHPPAFWSWKLDILFKMGVGVWSQIPDACRTGWYLDANYTSQQLDLCSRSWGG